MSYKNLKSDPKSKNSKSNTKRDTSKALQVSKNSILKVQATHRKGEKRIQRNKNKEIKQNETKCQA